MHTPLPLLRKPTPAVFSAVLATYLLFLASCSGGPTEEAANDLAERCGTKDPGVPVQALPYDAGTGEGVDGFVLGEGTMGVVFSNQTDTVLCDWLPLAKETAGEGRRALVYDYSYKSDAAIEVEAAAAELAKLGVEQAVLVGASKGAVGSLAAVPSRAICTAVDRLRYSVHESLFDGPKGKSSCRRRPRHAQKRDSAHAWCLRTHHKALSEIEKRDRISGAEAPSETSFLDRPECPTENGLVETARRT